MLESSTSLVQLVSAYSFASTLTRLCDAFEGAQMTIFARIDHSAAAAQAGLSMPPTTVLIYGSPRSGTPLMLATPALGLDLPLRVLVREDVNGQTVVAYHPAAAITNTVALGDEQLAGFSRAEALIAKATAAALSV
jgi:uncharacterized protein (DUF302 family)